MSFDRRALLGVGAGLGMGLASVQRAAAGAAANTAKGPSETAASALTPSDSLDQTAPLQAALDAAAQRDIPLRLPAGVFLVSDLRLRSGARLIGAHGATTLRFAGGAAFLSGDKADNLLLEDLTLDGAYKPLDEARGEGLINVSRSKGVTLSRLRIINSARSGVSLTECSGSVTGCTINNVLDAGLKSLDSLGLDIHGNQISDCGNNGILVWRSQKGADGSNVLGNRISRIRNAAGGTGEYGNGINVFRAAGVSVSHNRITDCAFTAVRGNAASNIQIVANSCERLGEVAIYSEFGFEGALIANNLIDGAATGISVTNFNEGGRLAVIQGNLIRNLFRREREPEDKRGEGIGIEADAVVSGNTIENAPTVGIQIGWGPFMRDVSATGNVIRRSGLGISITAAPEAGTCLVANNLISETKFGGIRRMTFGTPSGPDLAREPASTGRVSVMANVLV